MNYRNDSSYLDRAGHFYIADGKSLEILRCTFKPYSSALITTLTTSYGTFKTPPGTPAPTTYDDSTIFLMLYSTANMKITITQTTYDVMTKFSYSNVATYVGLKSKNYQTFTPVSLF